MHNRAFRPTRWAGLFLAAAPLLLAPPRLPAVDAPASPPLATAEQAKDFFDGKDLTGWFGAEGIWSVQDGEIVGKTEKGLKQNEFLKSKLAVGDFRLTLQIKLVPDGGNSGVQFHSTVFHGNEMSGPQADVGKGWWGKLYGENFHNKVLADNQSGEQVVKPGEWNLYEIVAVGSKVKTAINGHPCVDADIADIPREGIFGLQLHAGGPTEVRFKDLHLELNPKLELKTVK